MELCRLSIRDNINGELEMFGNGEVLSGAISEWRKWMADYDEHQSGVATMEDRFPGQDTILVVHGFSSVLAKMPCEYHIKMNLIRSIYMERIG